MLWNFAYLIIGVIAVFGLCAIYGQLEDIIRLLKHIRSMQYDKSD